LDNSTRFATLDALRGVAAMLVMVFHAHERSPVQVPGGYLAVDLFFALSGFVIALAYEKRLAEGMGLLRFAGKRLQRVYPMYLAGMLLGCAIYGWSLAPFAMLPDFTSDKLLPANVPMWSLLTELAVNLAFAALALRLGWRGLALLLAASGAWLASIVLDAGGADLGAFWDDAGVGLLRTVFSFTLGVAFHRLRARLRAARRRTRLAWLLLPALAAVLIAAPAQRGWWDLACIFILLPALLWLGTRWELPWAKPGKWLGDISFPLYCLHGPIVLILLRYGTMQETLVAFVGLIAAAWALDRWIDRPLRARLAAIRWPRRRRGRALA